MVPGRVHVIACGVLRHDLEAVTAKQDMPVSFSWLPGGLHRDPVALRQRLQEAIDAASRRRAGDRLVIGYGLCGMSTAGLYARQIPLVLPRVQDCIALFLGSDAAYQHQFNKSPGTYYIAAGWADEKVQPQSEDRGAISCGVHCYRFEDLVARHGQAEAEHIRSFLNSWQNNYQRAAWIDTGVCAGQDHYRQLAESMAEDFGWQFESIAGSTRLLERLLQTCGSDDEILVVAPHHVTRYDAATRRLMARPVWQTQSEGPVSGHQVFDDPDPHRSVPAGLCLGIDAGGTFTDAVIYDPSGGGVLAKAKARTTDWDYMIGIGNVLDRLPGERLIGVQMVCLSTTLATNAIVQDRGSPVGLLLMPPYGLYDPKDVSHRPVSVIDGQLEIDGRERVPISPAQVLTTGRKLIDQHRVQAFAITGFASHNNPGHELAVKQLLVDAFGLPVTCGHEVSDQCDYRIRATTAALNGRIIPLLSQLLGEVKSTLAGHGVDAPVMVVGSDGSLMTLAFARARPIQTIMSGPAASVAGARVLAGVPDALVVDVGGTTTDTALIESGVVKIRETGAYVGGHRTHVRALDMRTLGLGGDSLIAYIKRRWAIGPERVVPISWLGSCWANLPAALEWPMSHLHHFDASTRRLELVALSGGERSAVATGDRLSDRMLGLLKVRPYTVQELAAASCGDAWSTLPLSGLVARRLVELGGLTPTDLLHIQGRMDRWSTASAVGYAELISALVGCALPELLATLAERVRRSFAVELLKRQLDESVDADLLEQSPVVRVLLDNMFNGGDAGLTVRLQLNRPVIGIGAPACHLIPPAAAVLGSDAIIPEHAEVANAVGAVTSRVMVSRQVRIEPTEQGGYALKGLVDTPVVTDFQQATDQAISVLVDQVRELARQTGTRSRRVEVHWEDRICPLADGGHLFVCRQVRAQIDGPADLPAE